MLTLLEALLAAFARGEPVAFTALVETRGSTPQKAGATMLVFADGSQVGTLGGGCVEAEVKRRSLQLLKDGGPELLTFQLDDNYGWDDGLICGGRMRMLVDPIRSGDSLEYYQELRTRLLAGTAVTEAVVLDPGGNEPGVVGAADRFLCDERGEIIATRARHPAPPRLVTNLRSLAGRPRPYVTAGISYLPFLKRCRLVVVGAGHVGQKVAQLAHDADFDIWVADDREEYCNLARFPAAKRLLVGPIEQTLAGLDVDPGTYCLIVTRGHNHDEEALFHLAETPAAYVGMIGSQRKIKLIFDDLLAEGISRDALRRVHAPLGFDIGSQTVTEIAISIVAELIAHRNLGSIPEQYARGSLLDQRGTTD
jgi:xanthine dehydrogenase accessory factor